MKVEKIPDDAKFYTPRRWGAPKDPYVNYDSKPVSSTPTVIVPSEPTVIVAPQPEVTEPEPEVVSIP